MILTRERIELISFSPIYQLFTLYQTSSNCSINCERPPKNIQFVEQPRHRSITHTNEEELLSFIERAIES